MPRRRSSCCPCSGSSTPSPESPRILGSHPLKRTGIRNNDHIASQIYDPQYADYLERRAHEERTAQALRLISDRVQRPGNNPVYIPPDVLDTIRNYANVRGGKKTRKYKKRQNKTHNKKNRTNRRKSNKRRTNRRK